MAEPKVRLSKQQYGCATCEQSLSIQACAGSGKTRTMTAKIVFELGRMRSSARDILCITYTNVAVNEIETRLRAACAADDIERVHVCTIHSFCLNHIVKPHAGLLGEWAQPKINLAPPDSDWFRDTVADLIKSHDLRPQARDQFQAISINSDGKPVGGERLSPKARAEFLNRVRRDHVMIFPLIPYFALKILRMQKSIGEKIGTKFAWIMVDEFQDTSDIQVELLKLIAEHRLTNFCIVGDKRQSIYGFAGARPELFDEFTAHVQARTDLKITENYRSSKQIVSVANRLSPDDEPMIAIGENKDSPDIPKPVAVNTFVDAICDDFLPEIDRLKIARGDSAVLGPQWWGLWGIGEALRHRGVKVTGAGARPYRRSEVATMIEVLVARLCGARIENGRILRSIYSTLTAMDATRLLSPYGLEMRELAVQLEDVGGRALNEDRTILGWLRAFSAGLLDIPTTGAWDRAGLAQDIAVLIQAMIESIQRDEKSGLSKDISVIGDFADSKDAIRLMTIHAAKGAEYMAVAVIGCDEGLLPHFAADPDEARRQLYVGITRAKKMLRLYYRTEQPSRFLKSTELGYLPG